MQFVDNFLIVNLGGKERHIDWYTSYDKNDILFFLEAVLEYVWNWAKEAILVTSQKIRVSHYPQICKWASSLAYCTLALHVESIGGKAAWGYIIFFPGFYFSFFFFFCNDWLGGQLLRKYKQNIFSISIFY